MTKGKTARRIRVAEKHLAMAISFLAYCERIGDASLSGSYERWCHPQMSGRTAWLKPTSRYAVA